MPRVVSSETVTPLELSPHARRTFGEELFEVANELFTDLDEATFYRSQIEPASDATRILVHRNEEGKIVGFFTLHFFRRRIGGEAAAVLRVMVGMLRSYRGNRSNIAWSMRQVMGYMLKRPGTPLYGISLTIHPTSYMMTARYIDEFWPRPGERVPPEILATMTELADEFHFVMDDPRRPLVRKAPTSSRVSEAERNYWLHCDKPAARYYVAMNPQFHQGYGVVTFARLKPTMFVRGASILFQDRATQAVEGAVATALRTPVGARLLRAREARRSLRAFPLFAALDDPTLDALVDRADVLSLPPGEHLFRAGDAGNGMYVVVRGAVYVLVPSGVEGTPEVLIDQLGAGAIFGEVAMLTGSRRTASIRAAIPTTLVHLPSEALRSLMASNDAVREAVWSALAARIFDDHVRATEIDDQGRPEIDREGRQAWIRRGTHEELAAGASADLAEEAWCVILRGAAVLHEGESRRELEAPAVFAVEQPLRLEAKTALRLVRVPASSS